jgi:hypothetical protein
VDLFLQAAAGLQAAHEVGLVHANLSPDTVLVTRTASSSSALRWSHPYRLPSRNR